MTILFVSEIAPFPPNGGEKLRSCGLLKLLVELNYEVHAIINEKSLPFIPGDYSSIKFYPFSFDKIFPSSRYKRFIHLIKRNIKLEDQIISIIRTHHINVAIIDYLFYGQYIGIFHEHGIPVIYGTHNAQALLMRQIPSISLKNRMARELDYIMNRAHELCFFRKADALVVVSENDKVYHARFVKKKRITVIPNFLVESEYIIEETKKENYILMTANFRAFQNIFGLEWFIREVWDRELWNNTRLLIVGIGSDEVFSDLQKKYKFENVQSVGQVDDLKPYITKAKASIVPLLHGSGSRLKCLESMALKTVLISTSKGAEGIIHEDSIIIADTPGAFRNAILGIMEDNTLLIEKAYKVFLNRYSVNPNKQLLENIINRIVK